MKVAVTTVLDDKYFAGFLLTLHSLLQVTVSRDWDLVILEWGELRDSYKKIIQRLYPNTRFKQVETAFYDKHDYDTTWRTWTYNCNYRFDIFTFLEYDRVVFIDSDILFQVSLDELLKYDVDFGACRAEVNGVAQINTPYGFDAGVMSVGKKFLNYETRKSLLEIAVKDAPEQTDIKTKKWVSDEPILNTYFLDKITWLPDKFNFLVALSNRKSINCLNNYQFAGHNKPWYGKELREQFSPFVFEAISINLKTGILVPVILRKILKIYYSNVNSLKKLYNIDIEKYSGYIKPILIS